ncbi:choice-of-anchor E domain-containing protein [bacterium]|nr:MAG: choice-of-anchor E domain-containing protein [bacterium]
MTGRKPMRLIAFALLAALPLSAYSGVVVQTFTFPSLDYATTLTSTFTPFDASLGTLNSVTLTNAADFSLDAGIENLDHNPAGYNVYHIFTGFVSANLATGGGNVRIESSRTVEHPSFEHLTSYDGMTDFAGTSGYGVTDSGEANSSTYISDFGSNGTGTSATFTTATELAAFQGSSDLFLSVSGGWYGGFNLNNQSKQVRTLALQGSTITLAYEYSPVPEPTTLCALGLGLLAARRRRR